MKSSLLVVVCSALFVITNGQPIGAPENSNQNFVPGVFISADALKDLQDKAQQNQINAQYSQPITNERNPITNVDDMPLNPRNNENGEQLKFSSPDQGNSISNVPVVTERQAILSQPTASQPILSSQPIISQPILSSPQYQPQSQPQVMAPQVIPNPQPNQVILVSQPNYKQPLLVSQPGNQVLMNQQPGNQMLYSQPSSNQVVLNQPGNQLLPDTQVLLQNGQVAKILPQQPYTNQAILSSSLGNQVVSQDPRTNVPSGTTLYAMVPVNGASTNVGNGNPYYVPVQSQPTNQLYTISG